MRQVQGLSADGLTIVLQRFEGDLVCKIKRAAAGFAGEEKNTPICAMFVDVETTGTDRGRDKIIDLGYVLFTYMRENGRIVAINKEFSAQQDPGETLSPIVKKLTGYDDKDLAGKVIPWDEVKNDVEKAQLIIAHNAAFDRAFLDRYCFAFQTKVWACSLSQIPWREKGHGSRSLEYLAKDHGFFFSGHTALLDVQASVWLLHMLDPETQKPYLWELLAAARTPKKWVYAQGAAFELKDTLKARGYHWDSSKRLWKIASPVSSDLEENFLQSDAGLGQVNTELIPLVDNFKYELPLN